MRLRAKGDEEGRIRRSWRLTGIAWRVARGDLTLVGLGLTAIVMSLFALLALIAFSRLVYDVGPEGARLNAGAGAVLFLWTFGGAFLAVAYADAAAAALDGRPSTVEAALGASRDRLGVIAVYSLVATAVSAGLWLAGERGLGGGTSLIGWAWSFATVFVAPAIALEQRGGIDSIRRSTGLAWRRLGEIICGGIAIWICAFLALFAGAMVVAIALAVAKGETAAEVVVICMAVALGAAGWIVLWAVKEVFIVSLFRFGVGGNAALGRVAAEVETPFVRRERLIRPWLAVLGTACVALVVVGVILAGPRDQHAAATAPGRYVVPFPHSDYRLLRRGVGLYWHHRYAGEVEHIQRRGKVVLALIRVEPLYVDLVAETRLHRVRSKGRMRLVMLPERR